MSQDNNDNINIEPEANSKPKATKPKASAKPKATKPKASAKPKATKPKATKPKASAKPKATKPKASAKPKATSKSKVITTTEKIIKSKSDYLSLRSQINKKRPTFRAQESWRYKRIDSRWRKPKGFDSFMRIQKKSWPAIVKIGYRGPKAVRGLHPSGYNDILIHNINGLKNLDPSNDAIRLSSKIGKRYKLLIINEADKLGFKILNKGNLHRNK